VTGEVLVSDSWGRLVQPPDDVWAAAISHAVEATADDATDLADLVPPPPTPDEAHLWAAHDSAGESAASDAEAGDASDSDADLSDLDEGAHGWAGTDDPSLDTTHFSGADPAEPGVPDDPDDAGGWA
jgi:hypothetical protein